MSQKTIITVKEARKLLGKESYELDDYHIEEIIGILSLLAKMYISGISSTK